MDEREAWPTGSSIHHIEVFGQLLSLWDFPLPHDLKIFSSHLPASLVPLFCVLPLHNIDLLLIIPNSDLFCELSGSALPTPGEETL